MKKETLSEAVGNLDEKFIAEAAAEPGRPVRRVRWGALAACLVLVVAAVGAGLAAIRAEAKEYQAAVTFFEESGLSMEGLTRTEVKEVYRDITTGCITSDKTVLVLQQRVPGQEIQQEIPGPAPQELENMGNGAFSDRRKGVYYQTFYEYEREKEGMPEKLAYGSLQCWRDRELLWTVEFPKSFLLGWSSLQDGAAVWGYELDNFNVPWLARIDGKGELLWQQYVFHDFRNESISAVLENDDGSLAVVSRGNNVVLCVAQLSPDGSTVSVRKTEIGNYGVRNAVRLGEGYLVQLFAYTPDPEVDGKNTAHLVKLDRDGNLLDHFTYEGEDCLYFITDMAEFGGRVYLSAYAVPKVTDEGGRHEIAGILDYIFDNDNWGITPEELTPVVQDNYTAVLLLCDPEGGAPQTFYSVKASLGGTLTAGEDGVLTWDVESIVSTFFSPATSAFSIGGTCRVFRYSFDEAGTLLGQEDTGETAGYYR